jgi:hypothetical protein
MSIKRQVFEGTNLRASRNTTCKAITSHSVGSCGAYIVGTGSGKVFGHCRPING